ncbi:hypothetical protein PMAYCL1PPCAC_09014 [Pristionchus mayeri]|uniref:Activin types I and II receptor domain-containing protein n=1 Tax=Pristionchus mayeri TaxID=1317129 RepID=A0AAN4ZG18_9BILA|nr:hypothetical protein PMAYCL1PPCAC_09014 [Pristionchus mayeri]
MTEEEREEVRERHRERDRRRREEETKGKGGQRRMDHRERMKAHRNEERERTVTEPIYLGAMDTTCSNCGARFFSVMQMLCILFIALVLVSTSPAVRCYVGNNHIMTKTESTCSTIYDSRDFCITHFIAGGQQTLGCSDNGLCAESNLGCNEWTRLGVTSKFCCCKGDLCNDDPAMSLAPPTTTAVTTTTTTAKPFKCFYSFWNFDKEETVCPYPLSDQYCTKFFRAHGNTLLNCATNGECDDSKLGCISSPFGFTRCCCKGELCNDDPNVMYAKSEGKIH